MLYVMSLKSTVPGAAILTGIADRKIGRRANSRLVHAAALHSISRNRYTAVVIPVVITPLCSATYELRSGYFCGQQKLKPLFLPPALNKTMTTVWCDQPIELMLCVERIWLFCFFSPKEVTTHNLKKH